MKKYLVSAFMLLGGAAVIVSTTQSCVAVATSSIGLAVIKRVLLGGIARMAGIYKSKDAFLKNDLLINALPDNLHKMYNLLEQIAPNVAQRGRESVAEAAAYTVNISAPILENAVNTLTADEVSRIMQGGDGAATQVLREKTESQLVAALLPKVDQKLNEFGVVRTINSALQGRDMLSNLFGGSAPKTTQTSQLSELASEQLVRGIFLIIRNYETESRPAIEKAMSGGAKSTSPQPPKILY